ncbi:carbohydrate ABC transporter permease [Cellulosilyticum sp. I15G10I2]|uniref:carbohydrate ABC transporter permease n=1 Tax=Cellulosilyticum sp. I15G10I2 TaxID=1892843 RepID=UPI00085C943E|nr:sugar ABC transporter permease [Cellulosilyticum sp. I15G10I2]
MKLTRKSRASVSTALFLLPALLIYSIFRLFPAVSSLLYGFTDWNGLSKTFNFVGFKNYIDMFKDNFILLSIKNTIVYCIIVTFFQNLLGLFFAIMVDNKAIKGNNFFRTVLFLPSVLNTSAICFVWAIILSPVIGIWKPMVEALGIGGLLGADPLGSGRTALYYVAAVNIWQFMGYSMIIYLAGLQSVPKELYEAAEVDGCGRFYKFKHVTLPLIAPSITINVILTTVGTLKQFEHVFVLTNGGPGNASQVIGTAIYKVAFNDTQQFGYGIAVSTVLLIAISVISAIQLKVLKGRETAF